ncbi:MAG TPA: APC family permease [Solirubrobacteraceae bacterium]|nr:APC family permease [Solirubrobacteraceae bacterium]
MTAAAQPVDGRAQGRLRRVLGVWGTVSLSVGVMAPTLAMSATGAQAAHELGRAAPLAYVLAAVGIAFVAYGFVRLAGHFAHAGSVYAFVGNTLGPRAGFVAGWALLGTYIVFPPVSMLGVAVFGQAFLESTGIAAHPDWLPIALGAWILIWILASLDIGRAMRSLLGLEAVSVLAIVILVVVIYVKLAAGEAPRHQDLNLDFVRLPHGITFATVAFAGTIGFLSFAGFESAGSLGEESEHPTRAIPRSIIFAVAFGAVFYVFCMVAQTLGFGTDTTGVDAFSGSQAPLDDLAHAYLGSGMADVLDIAAMLSAIGAALGGVAVAARMLFSFARDGIAAKQLRELSPRTAEPARSLTFIMVLALAALVSFGAAGTAPLDAFFYLATIGVLSLLFMYILTNVGATRLLAQTDDSSRWELAFPLCGILVAGYTLYRNLIPVPPSPFDVFPYVVAAWLLVGLLASVLLPGFTGRIAAGLARQRTAA